MYNNNNKNENTVFRVVRVARDRGPTSKLLSILEVLGDALRPDDLVVSRAF